MLIKMERVPGLIWKWGGGVADSALGIHLPRVAGAGGWKTAVRRP